MTEFQFLDGGTSEAQNRLATSFLFAQDSVGLVTDGVLTGLTVTQTSTASANVQIAAGAGVVQDSVGNGAALMVNDTLKTLDVLTANPMGATPRNDIVAFDSATSSIRLIVGTPNAVPTDPTVPTTAFPLARLRHAASATTVTTARIDDLRVITGLSAADTGWISPSTSGFSGGVVDTVQYRKVGGVVYMRGNVQSFTAGSFQTLCTLPTGFRPSTHSSFGVSSNTTSAMAVTVSPTGVVSVYCSTSTSAYTGLANVTFPVG